MILDKKIEEVHKLSSRVDDLESQLNEAKEDCQRFSISSTYEHDMYFVYQSVASLVERLPSICLFMYCSFNLG
jgi:hypothetical protein